MCKRFFYENAQSIETICKKLKVNQFKISFRDNIASIYLGFDEPDIRMVHNHQINFKERMKD